MSCNWATLPDIIIVNIFSFLNHNDRVSASLVCRNWTTAFHAPQLWRSMKVHFYGNVYSEIKSIQFAQRHGRYLSVLKRFKNLQTLVMNINCLSDEIVNALAENCTGKLRFMHVKCRRNDTNYQVISSNAWKKMKVFCPELIVSFSIEQITELSTLHRLLPPEIPLQSLSYWSGYLTEEDVPWEPGEFINYVQNTFPSSLHKILMEFEDYIPLLDVALETMVINCKKLVSMDVTAVLPITFVDTLCRLRLNNQIVFQFKTSYD
ncbi:F-box only protein 39-like [Tachypleus tridentatus]|uniref:F-box only protein 39-like n=1 Tax=Tachypleus tridentatus TaxID=6853 RepID=UPI003FD1C6EB